jgi:hypothetical protein
VKSKNCYDKKKRMQAYFNRIHTVQGGGQLRVNTEGYIGVVVEDWMEGL